MEKNLEEWVSRISKSEPELGGFNICPFAKAALVANKIYIGYIEYEIESYIEEYVKSCDDFEVIVFFNLKNTLTDRDLLDTIASLQKKIPDMIFLKDHPDSPGTIGTINTSNGKYPVILVQPRDELLSAREKLKKTKYYDYWTEKYKTEIWSYGNES